MHCEEELKRERGLKQELTVEIAAPRDQVWKALLGDLAERGGHVRVFEQRGPDRLRLLVRASAGERTALDYRLNQLDSANTAVLASIEPSGPFYVVKRLLSFGNVEQGYLDALAAGLSNLQRHFEGDGETAS